jgi:UDPglucose--hexose-1-phosphate uridylyltransferase
MERIRFERSVEKAAFFSPLAGMELAEQIIEVRRDPLTGMTAVASSELATKEETFYGTTDWEYADELARKSREGCFFCPERVMETTPRYPEDVVVGGRLQRGRALVFPNLFPLASLHAVVTYPDLHVLRPSQFTPDLLEEGFGAAIDFAVRAERAYEGLEHLELCCNYMLPAGASLVHPHFQMFGGPGVPWLLRMMWERAATFQAEHGVPYWRALVDEETERGERFIAAKAGCTWLAPFAPSGGREVIAVLPGFGRLAELGGEQVAALAAGLSKVLAWYEREGLSAFNFTLGGGPLTASAAGHAVTLRIIARSAFKHEYRTDDYFLQKQLGGELIFITPEEIAATLRPGFAAA